MLQGVPKPDNVIVFLQTGSQAALVASVLQEPAEKFKNDVCSVILRIYTTDNVTIKQILCLKLYPLSRRERINFGITSNGGPNY